jgi:hypothetical protein
MPASFAEQRIGNIRQREPSYETCLDDVVRLIDHTITRPDL